MWIVRVALDRPYTFIVLALLILIASPVVIMRTPTDIFPAINIPVIAVAWQYSGLNTEELEGRITTSYERVLTTTVDNIQRIESTTVNGQAIIKVYLQPNARLDTANAQITAISQTVLRQYPPGTTPPLIINFSASSVPILQLALSGEGLAEQQLFDLGVNFLRPQLVTIPGVAIPYPFGGKQRQVMVDLNTRMLQAKGLAPADVLNTINLQNLVLPSGTARSSVEHALPPLQIAVSHGCVRVDHTVIEVHEELVVQRALVDPVGSGQAKRRDQWKHVAQRVHRPIDDLADAVSDGERLCERQNEVRTRPGAPLAESLAEIGGTLRDVQDIPGWVVEAPDAGSPVDQEAAHFTSCALPLSLEQVVDDVWNNGDVVERVRDHDLGPFGHNRLPLLGSELQRVFLHAAVELERLAVERLPRIVVPAFARSTAAGGTTAADSSRFAVPSASSGCMRSLGMRSVVGAITDGTVRSRPGNGGRSDNFVSPSPTRSPTSEVTST
jgi:hypothetical protein